MWYQLGSGGEGEREREAKTSFFYSFAMLISIPMLDSFWCIHNLHSMFVDNWRAHCQWEMADWWDSISIAFGDEFDGNHYWNKSFPYIVKFSISTAGLFIEHRKYAQSAKWFVSFWPMFQVYFSRYFGNRPIVFPLFLAMFPLRLTLRWQFVVKIYVSICHPSTNSFIYHKTSITLNINIFSIHLVFFSLSRSFLLFWWIAYLLSSICNLKIANCL